MRRRNADDSEGGGGGHEEALDLDEEVEFEAGVVGDQDGGGEGAAGDEED